MGKKANPTCVYCAKNYRIEDEAREKHPECYVEHNCRVKRYRLRNASQVNAKRRQNAAREKGIASIQPILPDTFWVEVVLFGTKHQSVHAIGLRIYQGNQVRYKMFPQHTQGFSSGELKEYIEKIMVHLEAEYDIDRIGRYYWSDRSSCPVCSQGKF